METKRLSQVYDGLAKLTTLHRELRRRVVDLAGPSGD